MDFRELTREELAAIRKLVTTLCANYDAEYGCLPLGGKCYMFNKRWAVAYCKYFQKAVLPTEPELEASLLGLAVPVQAVCAVCHAPFTPEGRQQYCSAPCQQEGNRRKSRERMRKKRGNT